MSILYINPGYVHLMEDTDFKAFEDNNEKFSRCKHYVVPLDYQSWHTVYSNDKVSDWYIRFDLYTNLANKTYNDYEGFLQIGNYTHSLTLNIDSMDRLVLDCNGDEIIRLPFKLNQLHSYELHLRSVPDEQEIIELWESGKQIYKKNVKASHQYFGHTQPKWVKIKNIVYLPNKNNYRFGTALSNFIIGNTKLGDLTIDILDTNIETNWEEKDNVFTAKEDGKYIKQTIKDLKQLQSIQDNTDMAYAVSIACIDAKTDPKDKITYQLNNMNVEDQYLSVEDGKGCQCEVLEIDPVENLFWDYDTIQKEFTIKSGGYR